jgi:hypothetical protein
MFFLKISDASLVGLVSLRWLKMNHLLALISRELLAVLGSFRALSVGWNAKRGLLFFLPIQTNVVVTIPL